MPTFQAAASGLNDEGTTNEHQAESAAAGDEGEIEPDSNEENDNTEENIPFEGEHPFEDEHPLESELPSETPPEPNESSHNLTIPEPAEIRLVTVTPANHSIIGLNFSETRSKGIMNL